MEAFREYKNFKSFRKPKRRIPLLRILFAIALLYAAYSSGAVKHVIHFVEEWRKPPEVLPDVSDMPWRARCEKFGGKAFFLKKNDLGQCSWALDSELDVARLPENDFVRYAASIPGREFPIILHWLADTANFGEPRILGVQQDSSVLAFFRLRLSDSSYAWVNAEGCRAAAFCPHNPLQGGALSIHPDFDFDGREILLQKDLFMGIGEAPVFPILSGNVLSVSKDSSGFNLTLDHGGNLASRISGLFEVASGVQPGKWISTEEPLGRLSPNDSAYFFLEVLRGGRFVRWKSFYEDSHIVDPEEVQRFRSKVKL